MSVIGALLRLLRRDTISIPNSLAAEHAAGVRDEADGTRRVDRIAEYARAMSDRTPARIVELTEFLDQWMIVETSAGWIPVPGWDDDLLLREAHSTREEAEAAVARVGGSLRPGRVQSIV